MSLESSLDDDADRTNSNGSVSTFFDDNADDDLDDDDQGLLQQFMEDDDMIPPDERTQYMINLCFAYVPGFSTDVPPYNHKMFFKSKKMHKPIRAIIKREIQRRAPAKKGYNNYSLSQLHQLLQTDEMKLPDVDQKYLKSFWKNTRGLVRSQ